MLHSHRVAIDGHDRTGVDIERYKLSLEKMYGQLLAECKNQWATEAAYTEGRESADKDTQNYLNSKRITSRAYRKAHSALRSLEEGRSIRLGKSAAPSQTFQADQWKRTCRTAFETTLQEYRTGEITRTQAKRELESTKSNLTRQSAGMYKLTTQKESVKPHKMISKILEFQFESALFKMNVHNEFTAGKAKELEAEEVQKAKAMRRAWSDDFHNRSASLRDLSSTYHNWLGELNSRRLQLDSSRYYLGELRTAYLEAYTRKCKQRHGALFRDMKDIATQFEEQDFATVNVEHWMNASEAAYHRAFHATDYDPSLKNLPGITSSFESARKPLLKELSDFWGECEEYMTICWTEARSQRQKGFNLFRNPEVRQKAAGMAFNRRLDAVPNVYKPPQGRKRVLRNAGRVFSALRKRMQRTKWQRT